MKTRCIVVAVALLAAQVLVGQSQPDFSGRWTLVRAEPASERLPGTLMVTRPVVRADVHGASMAPAFLTISIERRFVDRTQTDVYQIGMRGGVVGNITAGHDPLTPVAQRRVAVRWQDHRLVMETGTYAGASREAGPYTERTETWRIDDQGLLVVSITERRSAADVTTVVVAYRRP